MTGDPMRLPGDPTQPAGPVGAPASVRVLGVVLVLEVAVYACLTVLALVSAGIGYAARDRGGFGDLAAVLSVIVAAGSAVFAGLALATWLTLRTRRPITIPLGVCLHLLPVGLLLIAVRGVGTLRGLAVWWGVIAALALVATLWPSTRRWLAPGPLSTGPGAHLPQQ